MSHEASITGMDCRQTHPLWAEHALAFLLFDGNYVDGQQDSSKNEQRLEHVRLSLDHVKVKNRVHVVRELGRVLLEEFHL
jgi:hypothetical protein